MKKSKFQKLLSLIVGFAFALVAVVTLTAPNKHISANAEETEVPDTSSWDEVDACPGDALIGTWYRVYYTEDYFNKNFHVDILTFLDNSYDTTYSGDWTQETVPTDVYVGAVKLYTTKEKQMRLSSAGDIAELLMCNFTDEYVDFCFPSTLVLNMGPAYSATASTTITREITLKQDATISVAHNELKRLEEPTDEPTNPGDSTETPDEPTNPGDSTETPDDGTEEPKDATTDKVANWLNKTFGMNTNGNTVGAIAIVLAGVLIIKFVLGKK